MKKNGIFCVISDAFRLFARIDIRMRAFAESRAKLK